MDEQRFEEDYELAGIKVRVPKIGVSMLKPMEAFITSETPVRKLQFLKRTLFNTRQIKKTLDIRKFTEVK